MTHQTEAEIELAKLVMFENNWIYVEGSNFHLASLKPFLAAFWMEAKFGILYRIHSHWLF